MPSVGDLIVDPITGLPTVGFAVNAITVASNASTVPVTFKYNNVTNNAAGSVTITLDTSGAVDKQACVVSFYDFSAVAQTIAWTNTENSTQTLPRPRTVRPPFLSPLGSCTTRLHRSGDAWECLE